MINISKSIKSLRIILLFFLIFELFFAFISWAVTASGSMDIEFDKKQKGIFLLIFIIVTIISYFRGNALYDRLILRIRKYSDMSKSLKEYRNAFIIRAFILNIIPFMAFFIFMFTGLYFLLVLGVMILFAFLTMLYPKSNEILKELNIDNKN